MQIYYLEKHYAHSKKATFLAGVGSVLLFPGLLGFVYSLVSYPTAIYKKASLLYTLACVIAMLIGLALFYLADKVGKKAEEEYRKKERKARKKQMDELFIRNKID